MGPRAQGQHSIYPKIFWAYKDKTRISCFRPAHTDAYPARGTIRSGWVPALASQPSFVGCATVAPSVKKTRRSAVCEMQQQHYSCPSLSLCFSHPFSPIISLEELQQGVSAAHGVSGVVSSLGSGDLSVCGSQLVGGTLSFIFILCIMGCFVWLIDWLSASVFLFGIWMAFSGLVANWVPPYFRNCFLFHLFTKGFLVW